MEGSAASFNDAIIVMLAKCTRRTVAGHVFNEAFLLPRYKR